MQTFSLPRQITRGAALKRRLNRLVTVHFRRWSVSEHDSREQVSAYAPLAAIVTGIIATSKVRAIRRRDAPPLGSRPGAPWG